MYIWFLFVGKLSKVPATAASVKFSVLEWQRS